MLWAPGDPYLFYELSSSSEYVIHKALIIESLAVNIDSTFPSSVYETDYEKSWR